MSSESFFIKMKNLFLKPIRFLEYYFAKRWLDRTFGEQEYWGDLIDSLLENTVAMKEPSNE